MGLKGKVAVITGATGGLGTVVTHELAAQGSKLHLIDIDQDRLDSLADDLNLTDKNLCTQAVDLLDPSETKAAADSTLTKFGRVDILLHFVGGWTGGKSLIDLAAEDLTFMINQHIWTSFNVIQAYVPHLVENGWGRIVMITSPYASRPKAKGGAYAVGKAGQETLLLTLSQELKGSGVTVNMLQAKTIDSKREKLSKPSAENSSWTTPEELSASILYLLSTAADTVNGARIPLYGSYR